MSVHPSTLISHPSPSSCGYQCSCLTTADLHDDLSLDSLRASAEKYPVSRAPGADGWDPRSLAWLPDQLLVWWLVLFRVCQRRGNWPRAFMLALMALLPKPTAGFRSVAKTVIPYRIWCAARRRAVVKPWEARIVQAWDTSRPGVSGLDAALTRALRTETAIQCRQHVCALLWDFKKFFDSIDPRLLIDKALRLGFPIVDLVLGLRMHAAPRRFQILGCVSRVVLVGRSILVGCALSIPFTRLFCTLTCQISSRSFLSSASRFTLTMSQS